MDSLGDIDSSVIDSNVCSGCVCTTFERKGAYMPILVACHSQVLQREDELERRRASHHINFDAL